MVLNLYVQSTIKYNSNRLRANAEKLISEYLNGFRMKKGTINNIHKLRHITEKVYEYHTQRDTLFIDFRHIYYSIYRHKMIKILQLKKIPSKLIRMALEDSQAKEQYDRKF
jgi:hypothetical protein